MTHYMELYSQPFDSILNGTKSIELRLNDDKRKKIKIGDTIVFSKAVNPNVQIKAEVKNIYTFASFDELYKSLPLDKCGYLPEEVPFASPHDMDKYYSKEKQLKYGVVGIEIKLS